MKRSFVLCAVLVLAGCGGKHTTHTSNTASRNVTKPLQRAIVVKLAGSVHGAAQVRAAGSKLTAVSVQLASAAKKGYTAELAKGSCGAPNGLRTLKPLGSLSARRQSWSVTASLTQLTASPLAVVVRSGRRIVSCGQVRQG